MFRSRKNILALCLGTALSLSLVSSPARAADITLEGAIGTDDAVQLFNVTVANAGSVDIRSYGYAGGTTSTGTVVPRGGFDSILTLFSASGVFIDNNDDGAGVATDPTTGLAADARLTDTLRAGSYIVAVTEYDNFSLGNLADGFAEAGNPNFTADPSFTTGGPCPGNMFRDISGTAGRCRTGNWAVDFLNVASATPIASTPEPSAAVLVGFGLAMGLAVLLRGRARRPGAASLLAITLVAALASLPAQAQTNCPSLTSGPDYCHVSDFLNGQRNLLTVTDLQAFRLSTFNGDGIGNGTDVYQITTSNSKQAFKADISNASPQGDTTRPLLSFSAHMFDQPSAATLTTLANYQNSNTFALWLQNVASLPPSSSGPWYPTVPNDNPLVMSGAVADFTQDGYDDLALSFDDGGSGVYTLWVMTPNSVTDASKGVRRGLTYVNDNPLSAIAAGDFAGNGQREIAGLVRLPGGGLKLVIYAIDPKSLLATLASSLTLTTPSTPMTYLSIARGRFNSAGHDQLAVTFSGDSGPAIAEIIDFASQSLTPREQLPALTVSSSAMGGGYLEMKTGKFAQPNNFYDQIAWHKSSIAGGKFFELLSADPTSLVLTSHSGVDYTPYACATGIQVGNFDHRQSSGGLNTNAQIALMYCSGSPRPDNSNWDDYHGYTINIYSFDPKTLNVINSNGPESSFSLGEYFWTAPALDAGTATVAFAATDLQGRSLTLSEPTKISISGTIQPTAVVGVPPMHVDYIDPGDNNGPRVVNVSVVPDGFKTTYQQAKSTTYASSTTNTTSWSFGAKESVTAGFTIGDPDVDGLKATDTFTAAQDLKGSGENTQGAFAGKSFNLSATTGFGDEVSFAESQFNIWVYDVIGRTICPAATTCPPNQKVPLTVQYSAPDGNSQQPEAVQGQALQWYQPPWEPGNIFSYPANYDQLKSHYPKITQLTNDTTGFITDGSTLTQTATWSGSTEGSDSTGLEQNYSFQNDFSVNGSVELSGIGAQGGYSLDLSGSVGFSNLIKNTSTLGKSTGLEISKPGTFPAFQNFGYSVNPYIVGTTPSNSVVDNQLPSADIQTFGVLRAVFTADPLSHLAGGWWQQMYTQAPDVALNHPSRWTYSALALPSQGDLPLNCLAVGDGKSMDCAQLSQRSPANPWLDIFHFMRGFFISSAASKGQGPQLEQAKAGDVLSLQARVYNYSLADMDPGTEVHVRFYFTPWNPKRNLPAGESVLINEEKTGPIPAFNDSSGPNAQPNWVLVPTTFDTSRFDQTKSGNASVVFWVVVWMQDGQGNLLSEMPGHGLKMPAQGMNGIPGALTSFNDAAQLEELASDSHTYSNNVGLYKQVFYIAPVSLGAVPGLPTTPIVEIGKVHVSSERVTLGEAVVVSATLSVSGAQASGISVNFYDGDPNDGGRLFDVERVPHINVDDEHLVQTTYQSSSCGVHQLFAVINRGQTNEVVRRAEPVRMDCSPSLLSKPLAEAGLKLHLK